MVSRKHSCVDRILLLKKWGKKKIENGISDIIFILFCFRRKPLVQKWCSLQGRNRKKSWFCLPLDNLD